MKERRIAIPLRLVVYHSMLITCCIKNMLFQEGFMLSLVCILVFGMLEIAYFVRMDPNGFHLVSYIEAK